MKYFISLIIMILFNITPVSADLSISGSINNGPYKSEKVFFLKKGDTLKLSAIRETTGVSTNSKHHWVCIKPVIGEYNNLNHGGQIDSIRYNTLNDTFDTVRIFPAPEEKKHFGTLYIALKDITLLPDEFSETLPLHEKYPFHVVQVVYRADDTYLGYLTELYGTPFVIAPKILDGRFHQTEQRMGSDCASFAVYGRRRQGYKAAYNGPRGIYRYLEELIPGLLYHVQSGKHDIYENKDGKAVTTDNIHPGDIVHFGEQVSVFYRDSGIRGILDKDDELVQCFGNTPHVTTFEKSGFYQKPLRLFRWRAGK